MLKLAYKNGETLAWWWVDGYVDFDSSQRVLVKGKLEDFFAWHRKTQLPVYAKLLAEAQMRIVEDPDPATVLADATTLRKRLAVIVEHSAPDLADIALTLRPEQLKNIEKKFAQGNKVYVRDYLEGDKEHRHRQRLKKIIEQAESWFGSLSHEQEAQVRTWERAAPMDNALYMKARERRQQDILAVLARIQAEQPSRTVAARLIKETLLTHLMHTGGADFAEFIDAYNEGMSTIVSGILLITTPEQRIHAHAKLQGYIDDCRSLSPDR